MFRVGRGQEIQEDTVRQDSRGLWEMTHLGTHSQATELGKAFYEHSF
jgi:hypothetical protein